MCWPISFPQDKCAQDILTGTETKYTLRLLKEIGYKDVGGPWAGKGYWWKWGTA